MAKIKVPKPKPPTVVQTNFSLLKKYGGKVAEQVTGFSRIRSFNDKNSAITHDGLLVERQEFFYAEGYGMVRALPTTMHFIYEDKSKKIGRWIFMCTCGSLSGIVSYKEIKDFVTVEPIGYLLVCNVGLTAKQNTGIFRHADGSTE
jgi:hypothetical protein